MCARVKIACRDRCVCSYCMINYTHTQSCVCLFVHIPRIPCLRILLSPSICGSAKNNILTSESTRNTNNNRKWLLVYWWLKKKNIYSFLKEIEEWKRSTSHLLHKHQLTVPSPSTKCSIIIQVWGCSKSSKSQIFE